MSDNIIKTTAKFQEAAEPLRQKPIIQIEPVPAGQQFPNIARASIDSGRDNPFKPDGLIYKSADPIVDYYKQGPNQSRAQSPTDSQLLIGVDSSKKKKRKKDKSKKKREDATVGGDQLDQSQSQCRRWFCCCSKWCKCCKRRRAEQELDETRVVSVADAQAANKQTRIVTLQASSLDSIRGELERSSNGKSDPLTRKAEFVKGDLSSKQDATATTQSDAKKETQPKSSRCIIS